MPSPPPKLPGQSRRTERGTRIVAALIGVVLTILVGHTALLRIGKPLVDLSYDMPFMFHSGGSQDDIRIVYIGEAEGDQLDRNDQAELLERIGEAGAKAVAYDIIFDQPSDDPAIDEAFANAMLRFRGVDENGEPIPGMPQRHIVLACGRKTINMAGMAGEQLIPPTYALLAAADNFGVAFIDDESYFIRKLSSGTADEPSLTWNLALLLGADLNEETRTEKRWMNFTGPPPDHEDKNSTGPIPSCGAASVLSGSAANTGFLQDKIVVIGGEPGVVGATLGDDLFSTPYHRIPVRGKPALMSGVEVQANGLSNLLHGNWINRSSERSDNYLIVIAGLVLGAGLTFFRPRGGIITAVALVVSLILAGTLSMHFKHLWFPWSVVAFAQVPVGLVWGVASHSYIERFFRMKLTAEQKAIREAFAKYLSPQMLDRLTLEGFTTNLGGEKIQATMMFTDLEGFTDMCERVGDPERIVETLNGYFERTTGCIFDHDGVIIKYIGDAIFAAWGAPLPDPDSTIKAVRTAWDLKQSDRLVVDGHNIKTRIGLHTGEVVAGNLGSTKRVDYTLIGDAVNLSARLEGINKLFGTSILMSGDVHAHIKGEFITRQVGKFSVKGRKEYVAVHELIGPSEKQTEPEWIQLYHQALIALDNNLPEEALGYFRSVDNQRGKQGDGASRFFIERIESGGPIENGVVVLKEK